MIEVYLLLGSNLGDPAKLLLQAIALIEQKAGKVKDQSPVYKTKAWGKTDQADFLNQVIVIKTGLHPALLMDTILETEQQMGRIRTEKNAPRIIDIDILFYGNKVIDLPHLSIPHPLMHERRFVLKPLNDISPSFVHPVFMKTVSELLKECPDKLAVKKIR